MLYSIVINPLLLSRIKPLMIKLTILTLAITAVWFVIDYFQTMTVLAFSNGPGLLALGATVPVVLGACSAIAPPLSRIIWLSTAQEDLFDEVRRCSSSKELPGRLFPYLLLCASRISCNYAVSRTRRPRGARGE